MDQFKITNVNIKEYTQLAVTHLRDDVYPELLVYYD